MCYTNTTPALRSSAVTPETMLYKLYMLLRTHTFPYRREVYNDKTSTTIWINSYLWHDVHDTYGVITRTVDITSYYPYSLLYVFLPKKVKRQTHIHMHGEINEYYTML